MTTPTVAETPITRNGVRVTPVIVAGGGTVVHAGRALGRYQSGAIKWGKRCSTSSRDNHWPMPVAEGTPITCKRCLAKPGA